MRGGSLLLALLLFPPCFTSAASAGGRNAEEAGLWAGRIPFIAWQKDGLIRVAACNTENAALSVKASVGAYDTVERPFGGVPFYLEPGTVTVAVLPVLRRPTPRGDLQESGTAFLDVESDGVWKRAGFLSVQNMSQKPWSATMDQYVAPAGNTVVLQYREEPAGALRLVFIAKSLAVDARVFGGAPTQDSPAPSTPEMLAGLGLPEGAVAEYARLLEDHFGLIIPAGGGITFKVAYKTGAVDGCRVINVPLERHIAAPPGGAGGGRGPTFMLYDPSVLRRENLPKQPVILESEEGAPKQGPAGKPAPLQ